jgi:hypothetical protein
LDPDTVRVRTIAIHLAADERHASEHVAVVSNANDGAVCRTSDAENHCIQRATEVMQSVA